MANRDLSLFLWQHPQYMRVHSKTKNGYLPGFRYTDKVSIDPAYADEYAISPAEILFLYHAWHRLLGQDWVERTIGVAESQEFLEYAEERQPENWPAAPQDYVKFVQGLAYLKMFSNTRLP